MKAKQDKCHSFCSLDIATKLDSLVAKFSFTDCSFVNSNSEKLLTDRKLNFKEHVTNLCNKASKKIQELARVFPNMP